MRLWQKEVCLLPIVTDRKSKTLDRKVAGLVFLFVAIAKFPTINPDKDVKFREWFDWSNQLLKKSPGLTSRKLLKGKNGIYVAIAEFNSSEDFKKIHSSNVHKLIHQKASSIFDGTPKPEFFELVSNIFKDSEHNYHHIDTLKDNLMS